MLLMYKEHKEIRHEENVTLIKRTPKFCVTIVKYHLGCFLFSIFPRLSMSATFSRINFFLFCATIIKTKVKPKVKPGIKVRVSA